MSDLNDDNTRRLVRAGADQIDSLLSHFHNNPEATFESWGKHPEYLVRLKANLDALSMCLEGAIQEAVPHASYDNGT